MIIEELTDILWTNIQQGNHNPPELRDSLSMDEAYQVQLAVLDRYLQAGEKLAGWKVGLTAKTIQAQVDYHEPVLGFLLASGQRQNGENFNFRSLIDPGFENELCLTVGETLSAPDVTFDQASAAIATAAPALEIIEKRNGTPLEMGLVAADNNQQKAFVVGTDVPFANLDLATTTVDVTINGIHRETADGAAIHGTPIASVQWLANKLAGFGYKLEAGQRIMSGSYTRQYDINPDDVIQARFNLVGLVRAEFSSVG